MLTYSYTVVGMEILNPEYEHEESDKYTGFSNFGQGLLTLFHVVNQAGWADLEINFMERFENVLKPALFFNTYHLLANFVIVSLLNGLIWEIFTFNQKNIEEQEKIDRLLTKIKEAAIYLENQSALAPSKEEDQSIMVKNEPNAPPLIIIPTPSEDQLNLKQAKSTENIDLSNVSSGLDDSVHVPLSARPELEFTSPVNQAQGQLKNPFLGPRIPTFTFGLSFMENHPRSMIESSSKYDKNSEGADVMKMFENSPKASGNFNLQIPIPRDDNKKFSFKVNSLQRIISESQDVPISARLSQESGFETVANTNLIDSAYLDLEKTFYIRKILLIETFKVKGNQYDYFLQTKENFINEKIYLRVESEEGNDDLNGLNELNLLVNDPERFLGSPKHNNSDVVAKVEEKKKKLKMSNKADIF
jgi:Ion transport protein